jgi:hypothetical protein
MNKRCWDNFLAENYTDLDTCYYISLTPTTNEREELTNICCIPIYEGVVDSDKEDIFNATVLRDEVYRSICSISRKINMEIVRKAIYKCFKSRPLKVRCESIMPTLFGSGGSEKKNK